MGVIHQQGGGGLYTKYIMHFNAQNAFPGLCEGRNVRLKKKIFFFKYFFWQTKMGVIHQWGGVLYTRHYSNLRFWLQMQNTLLYNPIGVINGTTTPFCDNLRFLTSCTNAGATSNHWKSLEPAIIGSVQILEK